MQHIPNWVLSNQNRSIELFASGSLSSLSSLRPLLLIGGVHGDEPEGVALAQQTLTWLKSNADTRVPWLLIPCLNPDGVAAGSRVNARGVDLNRNYPAKSWSPEATQERYNPGPEPASEPEIKALVNLIGQTRPRLIIHCHSWHPCIVYTGPPGKKDAQRLAEASGYELKESIGYDTPGSLSEYAWHDLQIPVICIEEAEDTPLNEVWGHFSKGIKSIFSDLSLRGDAQ